MHQNKNLNALGYNHNTVKYKSLNLLVLEQILRLMGNFKNKNFERNVWNKSSSVILLKPIAQINTQI